MSEILNASFRGKEKAKLPDGASIISKNTNISVEEIENGYLVCKNYDIKYKDGDRTDYVYFCKKWFSKENPIEINIDNSEIPLEDKLD